MKHPRKINWIIVVIVILLIIALFLARNKVSGPNAQVVGDTGTVNPVALPSFTLLPLITGPTPVALETLPPLVGVTVTPFPPDYPTHVAETQTAEPTIPPTATSTLAPPQCTFPLAQTINIDSAPEKYSFSEPQVVLTDELQPDIVDWLPDNQNALITQLKLIDLGINGYKETIELFNPETKATQIYATRRKLDGPPPAWIPGLNAVVYPATNVLGIDSATYRLEFTRQLRISRGNPDEIQILADDLPQYSVAVRPDGSQIAYLQENQLSRLDAGLKLLLPVPFDRKRWDYLHVNTDYATADYKMVWRPNSSQILLYNIAYDGQGYTYILDAGTGQLCNLNFEGWALVARWSPDGRYLAIIRAHHFVPALTTDLAVLDTVKGTLYILTVPLETQYGSLLQDIAWAPDNHHLLAIASNNDLSGMLFLSDFISGQIDRLLPSYKFTTEGVGISLAWSPDGSKLLMNCPISMGVDQVCLISVQTAGK